MPPRKRKVVYPPPKTSQTPRPDGSAPGGPRPTVAIDRTAMAGRPGLAVGARVRISGTGLYAGEVATVERLSGGVIPSALVRTEAGRTRLVRSIDLEPVTGQSGERLEAPTSPAG